MVQKYKTMNFKMYKKIYIIYNILNNILNEQAKEVNLI